VNIGCECRRKRDAELECVAILFERYQHGGAEQGSPAVLVIADRVRFMLPVSWRVTRAGVFGISCNRREPISNLESIEQIEPEIQSRPPAFHLSGNSSPSHL
jgi:hypothetical protein